MKKALCGVLLAAVSMLIGCGGGGSQSNNNSSVQPSVSSIQVAPSSMSIGTGAGQQFSATAHMSDGTTKDVTATVQWSSSDSNIASISAAGMATGSAPGTVTITAQSGTMKPTATLTVSSAIVNLSSIVVSPAASSVPINTSQQFTAIGNYTDGSSADITVLVGWNSSSAGIATVSTSGLVKGIAGGSTNISASLGGISGSTGLTVTTPSPVSI